VGFSEEYPLLPIPQLLQGGGDLFLAEVAARAGFSDQSQFCHHFKRLVGVTPGQFRTPSRIA
jgi:AraC-like DNA-binding protein